MHLWPPELLLGKQRAPTSSHHMVASHTNILQRVATILKHKTTCQTMVSLSFLKHAFNLQKLRLPAAPKQPGYSTKMESGSRYRTLGGIKAGTVCFLSLESQDCLLS